MSIFSDFFEMFSSLPKYQKVFVVVIGFPFTFAAEAFILWLIAKTISEIFSLQ